MASTIDIWLDKSGGLIAGGSAPFGSLPSLTRNDQYPVRLRVLERNTGGAYTDASLVSPSFKLGIGKLGEYPTSGEFKLTANSGTSSAISYNATTTQFKNAISALVGGVSVTTYGSTGYAWIVTAATANTALSFGGSSYTLFPDSAVLINTRRFPAPNIYAEQVIELSRNPAVFTDNFTATSGDVIGLNKIQSGGSNKNETYELTIGNDVLGGSFGLSYAGFSIASDYNIGATSLNTLLSAITGIGNNNISVQSNNKRGYIITFVNELGLQNVTTALLLDSSGIVGANFYQSTITMSTVQVDNLFVEEDSDTITPVLEISVLESGKEKTLYQDTITIRKDLLTNGAAVPADSSSYYTSAQCNALFIQNSTSNIDATNRRLVNASNNTIVDYAIASFGSGGMINLNGSGVTIGSFPVYVGTSVTIAGAVSFGSSVRIGGNVGFYGNTPTAKPSGTNIVSGLTKLGLLSYTTPTALNVVSALEQTGILTNNTSTFGVFPQSPRTVTTLTSVTFGTVGANDQHYRDVTINDATVNDIVLIGLPAAVSAGAVIQGVVYKANTVCLSCVNADSVSRDVNTATYRITVIGY